MSDDGNQSGAFNSQFFDSLKDLNKQFQEEIIRLKGEKAECEEKITNFQEEVQCLKRNQVQLQERNAQLAKENIRQETQEKLKTDINQHWSSFVEKLKAELRSEKQRLEEDVKENEMLTEQLDKEIQSWKKSQKDAHKNNYMLQGEMDELLFEKEVSSHDLKQLTETNKMLQAKVDKFLFDNQKLSYDMEQLTETNKRLQMEVNKTLLKNKQMSDDLNKRTETLSKIANIIDKSGSTELEEELSDNNSEIGELSDENRPTRLAEKFSKHYDNDWTGAFKLVDINDEQQKIQFMLNILKAVQTPVYNRLKADFETLAIRHKNTILEIRKVFEHQLSEKFLEICTDMILKDFRIKEQETIVTYVRTCVNICWLMCRHEPPVHVYFPETKDSQPYDTSMFKPYTKTGKTGKYLDFVVWPALYLHENGPMLAKGVAQGRHFKNRYSSPIFVKQNKTIVKMYTGICDTDAYF